MALSVGFIRFVSSTNATHATGLLTVTPVGLPPTEHASLCWSRWFAKIQRDVIARGVLTSVADLGNKLRKYIRAYSKSARPCHWTYTDPTRRIHPNKIAGTAY